MKNSKKEDCLIDLQRRILTLHLEPGADLDEASLSSEYGLSRTPFREVLQRLAGEGYVTIASNRGAKVASMDISAMRVFFQTAPTIYAQIARLASENRTEGDLKKLREAQDRFFAAVKAKDASSAALANHTFHSTIGEMARNPYLSVCLDRLLIDHTRLGQTFYSPENHDDLQLIEKADSQHEAMIEAIAAKDSAHATKLTLEHWDLSRDRIERYVRPDPLPLDIAGVAYAI